MNSYTSNTWLISKIIFTWEDFGSGDLDNRWCLRLSKYWDETKKYIIEHECQVIETKTNTRLQPMMTGKVMTLMPMTSTEDSIVVKLMVRETRLLVLNPTSIMEYYGTF